MLMMNRDLTAKLDWSSRQQAYRSGVKVSKGNRLQGIFPLVFEGNIAM
jgi:hypothetical protein